MELETEAPLPAGLLGMASITKVTSGSEVASRPLGKAASFQPAGKKKWPRVGTCQVSFKNFPGNTHICLYHIGQN